MLKADADEDAARRRAAREQVISQAEQMTRAEVFRHLGRLKERYGAELYVKVVIPDDSNLTYNEAWDFTKAVLSDFDYYYIDGWE